MADLEAAFRAAGVTPLPDDEVIRRIKERDHVTVPPGTFMDRQMEDAIIVLLRKGLMCGGLRDDGQLAFQPIEDEDDH